MAKAMRAFFVLLLAVIAAPSASAQTAAGDSQRSARITGTVKDATGAPLANAAVLLTGAARREALTGRDGEFDLTQLSAGDYEVLISSLGFAPAIRKFHLARGETLALSISLVVRFAEEAVVTAGKTGERDVQDTPIAMSVLQARELERERTQNIEDMARLAPAVTFSQNTGFAQLTIRGIGTNAIFTGSDPSSAVYLDGVYLARPAMVLADFLDVERVEVLRGPQGTLYGRNAVGGALNVITRVPTDEVRASARIAAGNLESVRAAASVSGPLVRQRLMGSVAVLRGGARGFVRDLNHAGQYLGGQDVTAASSKLRFVLNTRSELEWSADVTHQDPVPLTYAKVLAVKPGFQVDNPSDPHEVRTTTPGRSRNLQGGSALRFTSQITPRTVLTSLTAFRKIDYDVLADVDITELDLAISNQHEIQHQWSEEVTVAYQRPRLTWLGGVFLFDDHDQQWSAIQLGATRADNRIHVTVDSNSKAVFGQATVGLTRRMSATAGLRYTDEQKTVRNDGQLLMLDPPFAQIPGSAYGFDDALTHHAWTPRVALEVRPNDHTLTYASATRGFKSGGFNPSSREAGRGFAPEWAWSYEAGLKTDVRRTHLSLSAFYADYTNLQVQVTIRPGVLDISNAAAATIKGVEAEYVTEILPPVRLGGYVNWLDARYDQYTAVGVSGVTGVVGDAATHRLNNAPEWTTRLWLEWNAGAGRAGALLIRPEILWQSTVYFTPFNDTIQRQSGYALVNVTAQLELNRRYSFAGYVRNVANKDYITGTFSSPPPAVGGRPSLPRQFGVEFSVRTGHAR